MKKIIFTIAMVFTMGLAVNAQRDAFFAWNDASDDLYRTTENGVNFDLPQSHGQVYDYNASAPLGSGLLVLTALGGGYALMRRKRSDCRKINFSEKCRTY